MNNNLLQIYNEELKTLNFKNYNSVIFNETELLELANYIKSDNNIGNFVTSLLDYSYREENYTQILDWNIGSTIQHFNSNFVIDAFKSIKSDIIYNSIGLTWVLGEFKIKDEKVIEYLYECVRKTSDSEVWWRASFSLELLGQEKAINFLKRSLKQKNLDSLESYLNNIQSKKSVIGILLLSSNSNVKSHIFPKIKKLFKESNDTKTLINSIWLLGRLKLIDKEIKNRVREILKNKSGNSELIYYLFFAIKDSSSIEFHDIFKSLIKSTDLLVRKMSIRGLSNIKHSENRKILEKALFDENNPSVLSEISIGLYSNINTKKREELYLKKSYSDVENGLIGDSSDKWYSAPHIYEVFSFSEDPENICLDLILNKIKKHKNQFKNPIDLATGTGRGFRYFIDKLNYSGNFYGVDRNEKMLDFLNSTLNRKRGYLNNYELINTSIKDLDLNIKSDFIFSSFGFPSSINDSLLCREELQVVCNHLTDDGLFVTLGWDETFNDELNIYWYNHIPDSIEASDFETWRNIRRQNINSARNCHLTWYKKGISVPLLFTSLKESARIMGYLFGRDATNDIVDNHRIEWKMSLGITLNTKKEIIDILKNNPI